MAQNYVDAVDELLSSLRGGPDLSEEALTAIRQRLVARVFDRFPTLGASADDLTQEALVRFLQAVARERVDPESRADLYLLKIVDRLAIDALRRVERSSSVPREVDIEGDDLAVTVVGQVDAGELVRKAIKAALAAGDNTAVAVLQSWKDAVHQFGDPTLAEVREVSGRSIPTIRSVLSAFRAWAEGDQGTWQRL